MLVNNWTHVAAYADMPSPQSATLGLHPVARELLIISRLTEGRRLSDLSFLASCVCKLFAQLYDVLYLDEVMI